MRTRALIQSPVRETHPHKTRTSVCALRKGLQERNDVGIVWQYMQWILLG